jgi:hypothetical protein
MKLELEDGTVVEQPSEHDIEQALSALDAQGNGFAILSQGLMTYVQTSRLEPDRYSLEYQVDDTEHHYQLAEPVSHEEVVAVFKRYARRDLSWTEEHQWKRIRVSAAGGSGCMGQGFVILVLLFLVASIVYWNV